MGTGYTHLSNSNFLPPKVPSTAMMRSIGLKVPVGISSAQLDVKVNDKSSPKPGEINPTHPKIMGWLVKIRDSYSYWR